MKPQDFKVIYERNESPPARGRGLKHDKAALNYFGELSPPARGRGLKHAKC